MSMSKSMHTVPIFVLNLDRDTDRMKYMNEQLTLLDLKYFRISAVDGSDTDFVKEYEEMNVHRDGSIQLLPGEYGCAASHLKAYKEILNKNIPYGVVLEDDVELPLDFKSIIKHEIAKNTRHPIWEYLLFDYWEPGMPFICRWCTSAIKQFHKAKSLGLMPALVSSVYSTIKFFYILPLSLFEGARNTYKRRHPGPVRFYRPLYLAGAYLVTYAGAQKLYDLNTPITYTADKLPNQARIQCDLRFYAYAPLVVRQLKHTFGSSILGTLGKNM
jgi:GR25 family glycosyltransferase involved in LPS biosynthesis